MRYFEHAGHANLGKSVSRNLGIAEARGRYLAFLDADDVYLPHKLAHQSDLLDRHPEVVMVYGATEYWTSWDSSKLLRRRDKPGKLGVKTRASATCRRISWSHGYVHRASFLASADCWRAPTWCAPLGRSTNNIQISTKTRSFSSRC